MTDAPGKIQDFVNYACSLKGDEKGEAQVFCDRLFQAFGHRGCIEAGAKLEYRLKSPGKHTKFPDLVWRPRLLLEMKSRGEKLEKHYQQVFEYWDKLIPKPRYVVLCNFDEFWIYDSTLQIEEPINRVKIEELPTRYTALNFLFPGNSAVDSDHVYRQNIPLSGAVQLFGREQELEKLDQLLTTPAPETKEGKQQDKLRIATIVGMGGVGKTELAIRYAWQHCRGTRLCAPTGGVCWVDARDGDVGIQIVNFARSFLNLNPPEDWDLPTQLKYCWRNWQIPLNKGGRKEEWLIVIDDVTNYRQQVKSYLPPESSQFKVLLTAREEFGRPIEHLSLDKLQPDAALDLLKSLVGVQRIQQELEIAEQLCRQFLDYLPLGLELVGRYLERSPDLSLKAMLSLLEKKRLRHKSVLEADATMTAKLGVADAFELSWERLDEDAQFLGCLLSLFASADIPWDLVKLAYSNMILPEDGEVDLDILEEARADLVRFYLLQRTSRESYRLHQLIREFLREKREELGEVNEIKQGFVAAIVAVAKQIPEFSTRHQIQAVAPSMPHVAEVAKDKQLRTLLIEDDLVWSFIGLGRFYTGQGLYNQAEPWYEQCLSVTQTYFSSEHSLVTASLSNLAFVYISQGLYEKAEPLLVDALEFRNRLLQKEDFELASILNNLAEVYREQGRYEKAKPIYLQALDLKQRLGREDDVVATILNNLAQLYQEQGHYNEAEPLCMQALELRKQLLGVEHPNVAQSLNNLALLYFHQGRFDEAVRLCLQALDLRKCLLESDHPDIAESMNNLASFYSHQGRVKEAEPLYNQALEIQKQALGELHLDVATTMHNLAALYISQGRYGDAEFLCLQALEIKECSLEKYHPEVVNCLNNLAVIYFRQGQCNKAEPLYLQALDLGKHSLIKDQLNGAHIVTNLADLYSYQGRYGEAELLYMQALKLRKNLQGEDHVDIAGILHNLAYIYYSQECYSKAESLWVQALKISQQHLESDHPQTVECQKGLARVRDILNSITKDLPNFNQKAKKSNSKKKPKGFGKA